MSETLVICRNCKFYALNTEEWYSPELQAKFALCTASSLNPVSGTAECRKERVRLWGGCGKSGRNFQPKETP